MAAPSNLPPGVAVFMIPGNTPDDEWWEQFTDGLKVPPSLVGIPNLHEGVNQFLELQDAIRLHGFIEGRAERQLDQMLDADEWRDEPRPEPEVDEGTVYKVCHRCEIRWHSGAHPPVACPNCGGPWCEHLEFDNGVGGPVADHAS